MSIVAALNFVQDLWPDILAIHRVNEQAFGGDTEADLVDRLRTTGSLILSLVAIEGQEVIGHVDFSPVRIDSTSGTKEAVGLGPLAVRPPYQRRGIGSELVRAALADLRKAGHGLVVVLGHPDYYPRFGFVPAKNHGVRWEHDAPSEAFMVKELITGTLQGVMGIAQFRPEFEGV
jgi:putative acetyltransferase